MKTVKYWTSLPKSKQAKCERAVNDALTPLKLSFFFQPHGIFVPSFSKKYQSELSLIPFLYDNLTKELKKVIQIIIRDQNQIVMGKIFSK